MWGDKNKSDAGLDFKLKRALASGDIVSFKRLVKGGVNVNSTYWYNSTLLHEAVQIGSLELVEFLLHNSANVNSKNNDHRTPFQLACRGGLKDVVGILLKYGADVNSQTRDKQTALHISAWRGKDEIVKLLIDSGADVNILDKDGWLPIHWAIRLKNGDMVEYLIKTGSVIDSPTGKHKRSPFLAAVMDGKHKIAQILLKHGADCTPAEKAMDLLGMILKDSQVIMSAKIALIPALINCGVVCSDYQLLNLVDTLTNENERETLLRDCKQIDQSLAGLCRSVVRHHLKVCCNGRSIYNSVHQLPIPKLLKEYITFDGDYAVF